VGCETLPEESKLLLATFSAVKLSKVCASICVSALTDCLRRTVVGVAAVYRMLSLIVPPERRKKRQDLDMSKTRSRLSFGQNRVSIC
jgi:hypothetical protein